MSAFEAAEVQYRRSLDLWARVEDPERVAGLPRERVLVAAADAARWAGHVDAAVSWLREAIGEIDPAADPEHAATLYERLGSYLWEAHASSEESQETYRRAFDLLRDRPPSAIKARVLASTAVSVLRHGQYLQAYSLADEALTLARIVGALPEEGLALNGSGLALTVLGQFEDGIASLREAVRIADRVGNLEDLLRAYGNLGLALEHAGRSADAVRVLREALARAKALELLHTRQSGVLTNNLCVNFLLVGDWDAAVELLDEILLDRPVDESLYQRLTRAEIRVARGEFADARALLDEIPSEDNRDPRFAGPLYNCMAEMRLWEGDPHEARAFADGGLAAIADGENDLVRMQLCATGLRAVADLVTVVVARSGSGRPARPRGSSDDRSAEEAFRLAALSASAEELMTTVRAVVPDHDAATGEIGVLARLCAAELARVTSTDTYDEWLAVAGGWDTLSQPYRAAYVRWRAAEAGVRNRRSTAAGRAAREALVEAERLGANPLIAKINGSVQAHRLILAPPPVDPAAAPVTPPRPGDEYRFSERERQVLERAVRGDTNEAIGRRLGISGNTVGLHLNHIYTKMGVTGRAQAIALAVERRIFPTTTP
jgi:DNA-binding CsgD family transcriptional regulator/tetratricopeptide (TPR) repeat protein